MRLVPTLAMSGALSACGDDRYILVETQPVQLVLADPARWAVEPGSIEFAVPSPTTVGEFPPFWNAYALWPTCPMTPTSMAIASCIVCPSMAESPGSARAASATPVAIDSASASDRAGRRLRLVPTWPSSHASIGGGNPRLPTGGLEPVLRLASLAQDQRVVAR